MRLGRHLQRGWGSVAGVRAKQDRVTGAHQLLPGTPEVNVAQSCLRDPTDYTVHGLLQARTLEWEAVPFSRESSPPRDRTQLSRIAGGFSTS